MVYLVAEWIHFALFGIILPTINTESVHFLGLMNSAARYRASGLGGMVWGLGSLISGLVSAEEGDLHTMGPD